MSPAEHVILCVNSGSSSLKFALYCLGELEETRIAQGAVEGIGLPAGQLWMRDKANDVLVDIRRDFAEHAAAAQAVSEAAKNFGFPRPAAAGHRVVHGGPHHSAAEGINASLLRELRELIPFAPLQEYQHEQLAKENWLARNGCAYLGVVLQFIEKHMWGTPT